MTKEQKLRRRLRALLRQVEQIQAETGYRLYSEDNHVWRFVKEIDDTELYLEVNETNGNFRLYSETLGAFLVSQVALGHKFPIDTITTPEGHTNFETETGITRTRASKQISAATPDEVLAGPCEVSPDGWYLFKLIGPDGSEYRYMELRVDPKDRP
jgi:hypothetical protein